MNIRVDLNNPIKDGTEVIFRSPVDCSQITGLIVYYPENGITSSKEFALADSHGNNVGDIDHLFAENVVVKVILDISTSMAFVQNADTNAYLEGRIDGVDLKLSQELTEEEKAIARENIGAMPDDKIKCIDGTNAVPPLALMDLDPGSYVLTGTFAYSNNPENGQFPFGNTLVQIDELDEGQKSVSFQVADEIICIFFTNDSYEFKRYWLADLDNAGGSAELENQVNELDDAVFEEVEVDINKFNPNTAEQAVIAGATRICSDFIPCKVGDIVWVATGNDDGSASLVNFGTYLVGADGERDIYSKASGSGGYTIPSHDDISNLVGIRITVIESLIPYEKRANIMVTFGEEQPTEFVPWGATQRVNRIKKLQEQVETLENSGGGTSGGNTDAIKVVLDKKAPQEVTFTNYGVLYANDAYPNTYGKTYGGAGWCFIDYVSCIDAKAVNVLICGNGTNLQRGFVFYDADKNPIKGYVFAKGEEETVTHDATYPVPEGAAFFRTTINMEHKPAFYANLIVDTNIEEALKEETERAKKAENAIAEKVDALHTMADKKVLVIGDSISTENNSTGPNYGQYEKWVMKLIKQGFFSADKVTNDSIHATGFSVTAGEETVEEQLFINRLKAVENPDEYDIVIVFGGINDFIKCQTVNIDFSVFTEAVDAFFEYLTDTFINARVCVFSPLRIAYNSTNLNGHRQQEYMEYIRDTAKFYCLPVLNLSEESGFYPWKQAFKNRWTYTGWTGGDGTSGDGVHPSEEWQETRLVPMIKAFLKGLIE